MIDEYWHDEDVAALFKIGLNSLRNKVSAGDPLPPHFVLPGMRARIWPRKECEDWMRQFSDDTADTQGKVK